MKDKSAIEKQKESIKRYWASAEGIARKQKLSELAKVNKLHLGHKHSEVSIERMRNAKLGKKMSLETRQKMSESHKGEKHHMYGKHYSPEARANMSEGLRRLYQTSRGRELRAKIDESNRGNTYHLGHKNTQEVIARMREIKTGKVFSDETRQRMSETGKALWQEEEHRNKLVKASRQGQKVHPNGPETVLLDILGELYPNDWKYVGDGEVVICGRNPDIINVNGKKSVILLHGVYWHLWSKQKDNPELTKEDVEKEDINFYKVYGWDCLIVWEDELKNPEEVRGKIREFVGVK